MGIRKPDKVYQRAIAYADRTSTYENRVPVPALGERGAIVTEITGYNNKDRAIISAKTLVEGYNAPDVRAEVSLDMTLSELGQFIAELQMIYADMRKFWEQEQEQEARRAAERGEIPTRKWDV